MNSSIENRNKKEIKCYDKFYLTTETTSKI